MLKNECKKKHLILSIFNEFYRLKKQIIKIMHIEYLYKLSVKDFSNVTKDGNYKENIV